MLAMVRARTLFAVRVAITCSGTTAVACGDASNEDHHAAPVAGVDTRPPATSERTFGEKHTGQYHLGPVDFDETEWHNACAPATGYRAELRTETGLGGEYLAGLSNELAANGGTCDACILIETATGRSLVARVVTYGIEQAPGDIDVSPAVYEALDTDVYPRTMTWQLAKCPDTGPLRYEFQTEANPWWTSLWVRNSRLPIDKIEVLSANHDAFFELRREADGTFNDDTGFGEGPFTLRLTASDGQVITDESSGFEAGALVESFQQFK